MHFYLRKIYFLLYNCLFIHFVIEFNNNNKLTGLFFFL